MKRFKDLNEQEILALAISMEEEDGKTYGEFAQYLTKDFPDSAKIFTVMQQEESDHRRRLLDAYIERFGQQMPPITREDVSGFVKRRPKWLVLQSGINAIRQQAEIMELETRNFYEKAAARCTHASTRKLLGDLAQEEQKHSASAASLEKELVNEDTKKIEAEAQARMFVLQIVQPGLVGLMDGSVSTLAPLFAAAFATHDSFQAFVVGIAAAVGAGISMGFAEALSDDGSLTGRGHPLIRGLVCGLMTTAGGLGHTLPYLIPDFRVATGIAVVVVCIELVAISYIRYRYMDTPFLRAAFQIVVGGFLVFLAGILFGSL
jgi:rubrerythrin